jgi:hypothetical protein
MTGHANALVAHRVENTVSARALVGDVDPTDPVVISDARITRFEDRIELDIDVVGCGNEWLAVLNSQTYLKPDQRHQSAAKDDRSTTNQSVDRLPETPSPTHRVVPRKLKSGSSCPC